MSSSSSAPASPAALCALVKKSTSPDAGLKTPYDGLACLSHACMLASGFEFVGLGEEDHSDKIITSENVSPLPPAWNASESSTFMFRYRHQAIEKDYILRISRLGAKTIIFGSGGEQAKTATFEVITDRFTLASAFPWTITSGTTLVDAFISMARIKEFSSSFAASMSSDVRSSEVDAQYDLQEHVRSQPLEGRARQAVRPADPSIDHEPSLPALNYDPLRAPSRPNPVPADWPPEFEDEHQLLQRGTASQSSRAFPNFGADDLRPPGIDAMNPLRDQRPHRGMYPTPEDIMFPHRGDDRDQPGLPSRPPPGARYDPVFPGDENGLRRGVSRSGPGQGFSPFGSGGGLPSDAPDSMFG